MGEFSHLRAAGSRLSGKPFEILTVSVDDDRPGLMNLIKSINPPGVHTWDPAGSANPVSEMYNIQALPTSFLIDRKGVIHSRDPDANKLAETVETLLRQSTATQ